jgi:hypothetical protein
VELSDMKKIEKEFKFLTVIPRTTYDTLVNSRTSKFINQTYFYNEMNTYRLRHATTINIRFANESQDKFYLTEKLSTKYEAGSIIRNENEIELTKQDYKLQMAVFENSPYSKCSISKMRYEFLSGLVSVDVFIDLANGDKIGIIEIENERLDEFDFNKSFRFWCNVSSVKEFQNFEMAKNGEFPINLAVKKFMLQMTCPLCGRWGIEQLDDISFGCIAGCFATKHTYPISAFTELLDFYNLFV